VNQISKTVLPKTHKLQGRPLRQWWQIADCFALGIRRSPKPQDKYANTAMRTQLTFLCQLPFSMALCYHLAGAAAIKVLLLASAAAFVILLAFLAAGRRHLRYALEVQEAEAGLLVKSLGFQRQIGWHEIAELFPTQNGEFFVLDCRTQGQFFLSNDLTDFDSLCQLIRSKVGPPPIAYKENHMLPPGFVDAGVTACIAIIFACVFPFLRWILDGCDPGSYSLAGGVVAVLVTLASLWIWRIQVRKVAWLTRVGPSSLLFRTQAGLKEVAWEQLTNIKVLGSVFVVKSRNDWFLVLAEKKGPLAPLHENLIAHKLKLLGPAAKLIQ
jgi:hypothetical protein